ncbi:MAG: class I SAM-dependent methyltransferase [Actinomycetota bacterium]
MFSDADAAALYDVQYPWDPRVWPSDRFYGELIMAAGSVLDIGCGTGRMLAYLRENGHGGRLTGLDPDRAALARARRRADIEWVEGTAADARWEAEFDLATMTGHAFQCLVTDEALDRSLTAIRATLRAGGRFVFETRHPQARAWQEWNPPNESSVQIDEIGRSVRVWHEVESVTGDVVTFTETTADLDGSVLRTDRASLRFLDVAGLGSFLASAGFEIDGQYGDWQRGPVTDTSREIITVARRR